MRQALRYWFSFVFLLLMSPTVLAAMSDEDKAKLDAKTPKTDGPIKAFFKGMFDDWTGWVMTLSVIGLIVLVAAYFYVKKKQAEE